MQALLDYLVSNFWQIAGVILVACFGAWLSYRTAYRGRFAVACTAFRAAFNDELANLESIGAMGVDTRDLLLSAHLKHSAAIAEFGRHLFWRNRSFCECWQQHQHGHRFDERVYELAGEDRLYLIYLSINADQEMQARLLAAKNIRALLQFARKT